MLYLKRDITNKKKIQILISLIKIKNFKIEIYYVNYIKFMNNIKYLAVVLTFKSLIILSYFLIKVF